MKVQKADSVEMINYKEATEGLVEKRIPLQKLKLQVKSNETNVPVI